MVCSHINSLIREELNDKCPFDLINNYLSKETLTKLGYFKIDADKVKTWIANGAQPTDTVRSILANEGIIEKKQMPAKTNAVKKKKD